MKEELSDFLKTAYKYNKVKDLKEAFEEYPVEDEWHEGKLENVLKEDKQSDLILKNKSIWVFWKSLNETSKLKDIELYKTLDKRLMSYILMKGKIYVYW